MWIWKCHVYGRLYNRKEGGKPPRCQWEVWGKLWASLIAQLVKNPPAMRETWVWSLAWEDPLEKGKATHSSILGLENSMDYAVHGLAKSWTQLCNFHSLTVGEQVAWGGKEGFIWGGKSNVVSKGSRGHRSSLPIPGSQGAVEWDGEFMAERTRLQRKQEEKGVLPPLKSREDFSSWNRGCNRSRCWWSKWDRLEVSLWGKRAYCPHSGLTPLHHGCADIKCPIGWVVE